MSITPADYPPPFEPTSAVVTPQAGEDERIEVGVLIVGGGPAGFATAIRLGQLLAEDPELAEQLGEVPIALADKGKAAGSHLLSGAVMKPGPIRDLFPDLDPTEIPHYWEVDKEAVYFLTKGGKVRVPPPPQMKNHGNWVVSVSQMARWMSDKAEELGVYLLPETDAQRLLVENGRVRGVVTGDKGRGRQGEELGTFEPGIELHAGVTVLAEGTPGHLTQVLRRHFELDRGTVQTWELGVKEVWEVAKPLRALIHTAGWPLRLGKKYREYGGSWIYPMGDDKVSIGFVIGLDYADATTSVHDLLQAFKTHPFVKGILDGGRRITWGAKTIPGSGIYGLPSRLHVPGALLVGDSAGFVDMAALKGVNYAIRSGMLAADAIYEALKAGKAHSPAGLWGYDKRIKDSEVWKDLWKVRNIRPGFQRGFLVGGMIHGMSTGSFGKFPKRVLPIPDAKEPVFVGGRQYPKPDGALTFDKLSSVYLSGNKTRDDQPSHIRVQTQVPRELAVAWEAMCPAKVYEIDETAPQNGTVTVHVNASNCVQCGAITAKGGRLTPPEGGSGPEYTIT
ncbi:MAG TPA: electron-transfer flavoprotein:ubiquinone oxidoreductase [Miltoncostaeaceae bacterium]|nr:electron-transfer flavoprotein:ubiquinone oxidoreductase [Miltoncostaeaceae bacterium]